MKKLLFIISIITILSSCNSDDNTPQETNFYALTVGNSWVYKHYTYDNDTNSYNETGVVDSISIIDTEDIYGDTFYKFKQITTNSNDDTSNYERIYFLRDYNGNLIDENNNLFFSNTNYDEIFIRDLGNNSSEIFKLQENEVEIATDAGIFNCSFAKQYQKNLDTNEIYATRNSYYKKNIGLIKRENIHFINGTEFKTKISLVSYTVN